MVVNLLDYRMQKYMATIHSLIAELVMIRKYKTSLKNHSVKNPLNQDILVIDVLYQNGEKYTENQERVLQGLRMAEKRLKKELMETSKQFALICRHETNHREQNIVQN